MRTKPMQQTNTKLISRRYHCVCLCVPQAHRRYRILVHMALCESGNEGTMKLLAPHTRPAAQPAATHTRNTLRIGVLLYYTLILIIFFIILVPTSRPLSVQHHHVAMPPHARSTTCPHTPHHTTHTGSETPCCCLQSQCLRADLAHAGTHNDDFCAGPRTATSTGTHWRARKLNPVQVLWGS